MPIIPTLGKWKQSLEFQVELEANMVYMVCVYAYRFMLYMFKSVAFVLSVSSNSNHP